MPVSKKNPESSRRSFLATAAVAASAALVGLKPHTARAAGENLPHLSESDPLAKSLGYQMSAANVDKSKFPTYKAGDRCAECRFFQGTPGEKLRLRRLPDLRRLLGGRRRLVRLVQRQKLIPRTFGALVRQRAAPLLVAPLADSQAARPRPQSVGSLRDRNRPWAAVFPCLSGHTIESRLPCGRCLRRRCAP